MSIVIQRTPSWKSFGEIKHLFIFGASYCSTVAAHYPKRTVIPTPCQPLGVPFPGESGGMWNEPGLPNWVGHLLASHRPGPRYKPNTPEAEQEVAYMEHPLLVYNYAIGGSTSEDVLTYQLPVYLNGAGTKPDWASWTAEESLFITWVGINDCAIGPAIRPESMKNIFETQKALYETGARNFVFINVPPIHRTPAIRQGRALATKESLTGWNDALHDNVTAFSASHPDATTLIFSAYETFTTILDHPIGHGLPVDDLRVQGGAIWVDHLHPSSAVHAHVARYLADFLGHVV